jgi:undecaprenyl-diphosphatase
VGSLLGETGQVVVLTVGYYLTGRVVNRSWHQSTALMFAVVGEVVGFVLISLLVDRPRPPVPHLDAAPPTDSFPSGHVAATTCCYGMFAVLLYRRWALTRGPSRRVAWLFGAGAGLIVVAVAVSRLYRGMHHLTDVLGGMLFGGAWLLIVVILVLRPMCPPEYQLPRWL